LHDELKRRRRCCAPASRRMRRTPCRRQLRAHPHASPTSSICRCTCTCTKPRRKSRTRCASTEAAVLAAEAAGSGERPPDRGAHDPADRGRDRGLRRARRQRWCIAPNPTSSWPAVSAPIEALRRAGVNLAIGTDGAASNNDLDMIGEMKHRGAARQGGREDAAALDAAAAARGHAGRRACDRLGRAHRFDRSRQAMRTSTRAISRRMETLPLYNPISQLVYASNRPRPGQRCLGAWRTASSTAVG
jgi:hypothetical protein